MYRHIPLKFCVNSAELPELLVSAFLKSIIILDIYKWKL